MKNEAHELVFRLNPHLDQKHDRLVSETGKDHSDLIREYMKLGIILTGANREGDHFYLLKDDSRIEVRPFQYRSIETLLEADTTPSPSETITEYTLKVPDVIAVFLREAANTYQKSVDELLKEFFILGLDVFSEVKFNGASTVLQEKGVDRPVTLI